MKTFLLFLVIIFFLFLSSLLKAQTVIHGIVKDTNGKTLQFANVFLLKLADSSLVKGTVSDAAGKYSFIYSKNGKYRISASFTGMEQSYSPVFEISPGKNDINQGILSLQIEHQQLNKVTVTAKKPMFEQLIDRMVINVKSSITIAGGTALDVLEKSPGITLNRQNNSIAINGKNGVVVMINGKINYMPMDALVQLLDGISAGNIEKIELITTPPAKYDANGNAGYINIVLINNPYAGLSGSYFLTAGYGKKVLADAGINFNYRNGKVNLYGNYNYSYHPVVQTTAGFTQLTKGGDIVAYNSSGIRNANRQVHNLRVGMDYQLDSSTIIGALISGYDNQWTMVANNGEEVQINSKLDTTIDALVHETNHWQNLMANFNYQHTFKPGKILYFDANYIYYKDNNPISYNNVYYDPAKLLLYNDDIRSGKITPIHMLVFSSDYTTPLNKKITMEAGAKLTLSKFTNDIGIDHLKQNIWIADTSLSANYLLKENIAAAYSSFTINLNSKTTIKAGLRYEYTYSNLGTTQTADIVNRKYGELFPTFYISQKLNNDNSMNFSYSRRITRPTFNDLAPFTIFFDPKTYFTGNPALQPSIANSVQVSYMLKKYIFSLNYTYENNSIEGFQTQRIDTITNLVYMTAKNFNYEQYLTASFSLPLTITKWWNMQNNINVDWKQINTEYNNLPFRLQIFDYNLNTTQRFTLPKDFSVELTGLYYSDSYFGTYKTDPFYQVDAGIQKKLNNKKDVIRFTANDMFNSGSHFRFTQYLPIQGVILKGDLNFGMVEYKLTYTHNFGNNTLKGKRERLTHAEEELNRVHN